MSDSTVMSTLRMVASLRLTLAGLLWLAVGLVVDQNLWLPSAWALTPPLALLAVNLAAALLVDPRFRRQPALFAFHLCLLVLAVLAGYGQLARFDARLPLVEGQEYADILVNNVRQGPLAPAGLADGVFRQGAIAVDYTPGLRRGATRSRVWVADRGWLEVGDDVPLRIDGYRFYTTSNKGIALLLTWLPRHGEPQLGALQFPSYPATELGQVMTWRTPAGQELEMRLGLPPSPYNQTWTLQSAIAKDIEVAVVAGDRRETLRPGQRLSLDGGELRYESTAMWMGYELNYNPILPWMFSVATLCVVFMSVHFVGRVERSTRATPAASSRSPA